MSEQQCPNCHYPIPERKKPGEEKAPGSMYHPSNPDDTDSVDCAQCFYQAPQEPQNEDCPQCHYSPDKE